MGTLVYFMYSRTVHIELLEDLTSDCFLNARRCFLSIRGKVVSVLCDHGTNLVGGFDEVQKINSNVTDSWVKSYLLAQSITLKFITPTASHQGGSWEQMIRSVRAVLNGMSTKFNSRMDTQSLSTAFYEAMNVINSRPLTMVNIDDPEEKVISPNFLLTMKDQPVSAMPPEAFSSDDLYSRLRWHRVQCFAD